MVWILDFEFSRRSERSRGRLIQKIIIQIWSAVECVTQQLKRVEAYKRVTQKLIKLFHLSIAGQVVE